MSKTTKAEFLAAYKRLLSVPAGRYARNQRENEFAKVAERYADALIEEDEGEKESRTGTCRWCGQTYENHSDNGPATRMPCLYSALGLHPDSSDDIAQLISEIRDEERGHFHNFTKLLDRHQQLKAENEALREVVEAARRRQATSRTKPNSQATSVDLWRQLVADNEALNVALAKFDALEAKKEKQS